MPTISRTARIRGTAEDTFEALTDLRGYGRWLDPSADYAGTIDISPGPTRVGTEYVERSRLGVRRGVVTALRAPGLVVFHQPMTLRPAFAGVLDIVVTYSLAATSGGVDLERVVEVTLPPLLRPFAPLVLARFRRESERTVDALQDFVERG
ncbi:SRPBCC family protein [Actinophytocola sp.]|uniref:SRPBCC family protein n=1 Tax=Actinophytocola sp. TaxID=1872138 RepID=UPI00389AE308